jgi:hypothetical protein
MLSFSPELIGEVLMRKALLVMAALSLFSSVARAADRQQMRQREVEVIHSVISSLPIAERKAVFREMAASMKADLWSLQLRKFIGVHPDLSAEQLAITAAAATLLVPRTFELSTASPEWEAEVGEPLRRLETAARMQFPREMLVEAFGRLGPDESAETTARPAKGLIRRVGPQNVPNCNCTRASDWCLFSDCGGAVCYASTDGCGWWWQYACSSKCG